MPKEKGGLGLRGLEIWNKAAMSKHLWSLCSDFASSLWVSWTRCYLLRGRSIWELKCPGDCSWSWRKILGFRDIGRDKMKIRIGNGRRASLWYDNWHPLGPLEKILGERIIRESKLSRLAKVADIMEGDTWRWPSVRSLALSDLMRDTLNTFRPDSNREDVLYAFILWLAIQGGIYTHTKLLRFVEDLDHLFFACPFSERVWNALHAKCNLPWVQWSWLEILSWMEQFRGRSMSSIVIRLMFAASELGFI
ncbi:uncharacterized protein LOC111392049 [Olea europaea var. sylvestris]|uniref:uncharacterized protein LOC111392049 n=1 Tax=Olea europaea var. sylvestris TaxID=158386 RepID=UPI000C1D39DA|nr:uncharacterized protein LOC111392049 [Olea europaea var. sylvestris]